MGQQTVTDSGTTDSRKTVQFKKLYFHICIIIIYIHNDDKQAVTDSRITDKRKTNSKKTDSRTTFSGITDSWKIGLIGHHAVGQLNNRQLDNRKLEKIQYDNQAIKQ